MSAVAGVPIKPTGPEAAGRPGADARPRLFVQERVEGGRREDRFDMEVPGLVRAIAISADERTLWASGTASGQTSQEDHVAWLMAVDLAGGAVQRRWDLPKGMTVDRLVAHPGGQMVLVNGDKKVPYEYVARGMAILRSAGATKIGFVTEAADETVPAKR